MRLVASDVADAVHQACQDLPFRDDCSLAMQQRELELAIRKPSPRRLAQAREFLAAEDPQALPPRAQAYAKMAVELDQMPPSESIVLQALRIGDMSITAIPCEVFVEIGLELKRRSPLRPTFTIELANGHNRYLPTPEHHRLGGYETWLGTNMLETHASEKIVDALLEMLQSLTP